MSFVRLREEIAAAIGLPSSILFGSEDGPALRAARDDLRRRAGKMSRVKLCPVLVVQHGMMPPSLGYLKKNGTVWRPRKQRKHNGTGTRVVIVSFDWLQRRAPHLLAPFIAGRLDGNQSFISNVRIAK